LIYLRKEKIMANKEQKNKDKDKKKKKKKEVVK